MPSVRITRASPSLRLVFTGENLAYRDTEEGQQGRLSRVSTVDPPYGWKDGLFPEGEYQVEELSDAGRATRIIPRARIIDWGMGTLAWLSA